ncbi:MAG TPA: non-homologous end-joining DNA ligase [Actinomycetota bacterium]|jgi:bifunctional non-homologous end joining protein LigD
MLATLTEKRFSDPAWIYERKLDGERCVAFRQGGQVRLMSRNEKRIDNHYPEVAEALVAQEPGDFIVDGEIVAFEGSRPSFARLQRRMQLRDPEAARRTGVAVYFYLFDVLHVQGLDVTAVELRYRKAILRKLLSYRDPLRFTTHRNRDGEAFWRQACGKGWEGIIAKRGDSRYEHRRSPNWLKFKCVNEQEFVIGGYTDPKGSRTGFGALLIGYYDGDRLVYAGKVGTGFVDTLLDSLSSKLARLERKDPPFDDGVLPRKGVHWVHPELVGQVGFSEWTRDGQLRHPRFMGLREDKPAREVVRERPQP